MPAPVFGPLLEQIDDLDELRCTLRILWMLSQKKGHPRFVTLSEALADKTLVTILSDGGTPDHARVRTSIGRAVQRGTFASAVLDRNGDLQEIYALNSDADREALSKLTGGEVTTGPSADPVAWEGAIERPNIFALYEANVGMLGPIIADELREAEEQYPVKWIEDAFHEAVAQNKRSWRYISRILERWDREGRHDGKPGRYTQKVRRY